MESTAACFSQGGGMKGEEEEEIECVVVNKRTLQTLLEDCHRALEQVSLTGFNEDNSRPEDSQGEVEEDRTVDGISSEESEADKLYGLIKSRIGCQGFLDKIERAQKSRPQHIADEGSSWDMVNNCDLWDGESLITDEAYVIVNQEDIVDGIACFMAQYLSTLKETQDMTPNQLQKALSRTFSLKKRKGKLRKAWEGSKVIYNVASWGATLIGIYQNPVIFKVASKAFWASCRIISKFV